ncbi:hypothetical protein Mgra_00000584 [Meloidogyne graminicola]|uniref:Uncharacterized protein n=1 Tax=Meloidogyne graminicola TaxID=189291 RepID=A0A8T0A424_9BILA|nr:hypothetical protein Mgra_00000584 [Meloidogyne graminicola]
MSKSANRLLSHLTNSSIESAPDMGNLFGHRSIKRQMSNAVYIYRHPLSGTSSSEDNWSQSLTKELENVTGNKLRPVGSVIRRNSSRRRCKSPSLRTDLPSNPPSPPLDPTLKQQQIDSSIINPINCRMSVPAISIDNVNIEQQERNDDIIPFMDNKSTTAATADELMQMLMEDDGTDRPIIFTVFEAANIDGVKHLSSKSRCTRYTWFILIILFICLCFYQIGAQAMMYWLTPVATNIIAIYPEFIPFPVVAICNSNQHRLTWITSENIQQREINKPLISNNFFEKLNHSDIFDKDMDAGNFLQNSAHQRTRMIVRCELPNGSRCTARDFKPVWTLTGLCWAINIDPTNPIQVNGAGPGNALRLLSILNVMRELKVVLQNYVLSFYLV